MHSGPCMRIIFIFSYEHISLLISCVYNMQIFSVLVLCTQVNMIFVMLL